MRVLDQVEHAMVIVTSGFSWKIGLLTKVLLILTLITIASFVYFKSIVWQAVPEAHEALINAKVSS